MKYETHNIRIFKFEMKHKGQRFWIPETKYLIMHMNILSCTWLLFQHKVSFIVILACVTWKKASEAWHSGHHTTWSGPSNGGAYSTPLALWSRSWRSLPCLAEVCQGGHGGLRTSAEIITLPELVAKWVRWWMGAVCGARGHSLQSMWWNSRWKPHVGVIGRRCLWNQAWDTLHRRTNRYDDKD